MKALLKGKGKTLKCEFEVTVHTLAPWSPGAGALSIRWSRGAAKRGAAGPPVEATAPHTAGDGYAAYEFGQGFTVPATLTKVGERREKTRGEKGRDEGVDRRGAGQPTPRPPHPSLLLRVHPSPFLKSAPASPFDSKLLTLEITPVGQPPVGRVILDLATFAPGGPRAGGGGAAHACSVGPASATAPSTSSIPMPRVASSRGSTFTRTANFCEP